MAKLEYDSEDSPIIKADIFDSLLASAAHVNEPCNKHTLPPVLRALYFGNVECIKKLIQSGARLGRTSYGDNYVCAEIVRKGNWDVLNNIIDEYSTDCHYI